MTQLPEHTVREARARPCAACRAEGPTMATGLSEPVAGVNKANLINTEQGVFITQKQLLLQTLIYLMHSSSQLRITETSVYSRYV